MPRREIHVWWMDWDRWPWDSDADWSLLTDGERNRVVGMGSPGIREEFLRSRSALRRLLALYLQRPPHEVSVQPDANGKPALVEPGTPALHFNLSHSPGHLLLALFCGSPLGVDVDRLDRSFDGEALARRILGPSELEALEGLPPEARAQAVLRSWIRKEAYSKARGLGFQYGFRKLRLAPDAPPAAPLLLGDERDPGAPSRWWIRDLPLPRPLGGALSARRPTVPFRLWTFPGR